MRFDKYVKKTYYYLEVRFARRAVKQVEKLPWHIRLKLFSWCDLLGEIGLREARKQKGYHDEPLKGKRKGQRSVRLSKGYRAIYKELTGSELEVIEVIEVNKHEY
ncbi:MAG: type II toxin-antitoxin system mRNA interferase toxin, RelE/StbE family [Bdellovibrionales bacterium]|nr:type II toxin-antitoxin system mRNA interferase toxin, RelE/StbE family [Bdellovibrionales bacterium]